MRIEDGGELIKGLQCADTWTRWVAVFPTPSKAESQHLCDMVVRLSRTLNYYQRMEVAGDREPSMGVKALRHQPGIETIVTPCRPEDKGRTAMAER